MFLALGCNHPVQHFVPAVKLVPLNQILRSLDMERRHTVIPKMAVVARLTQPCTGLMTDYSQVNRPEQPIGDLGFHLERRAMGHQQRIAAETL